MPGPDIAGEAGRAGLYAIAGGLVLKLAESLLRHADRRHRDTLDDVTATVKAGAEIREELRKSLENARELEKVSAGHLRDAAVKIAHLEQRLVVSERDRQDAEAELRLWKKGVRSPHPGGEPRDGG
jgi:hypothetical protein